MKKKIILISLIILQIPPIYLSYIYYLHQVEQDYIINDINLNQKTFDYESFNVDFPEYGSTAMNSRSIKARYLSNDGKYQEALDLLYEKDFYDPLHMDDLYKAISYYYLKKTDSFNKYAAQSYIHTPKIASHYLWYIKSLSDQKKINEILNSYIKIKDEKDIHESFHAYFFMTALNYREIIGDTLKTLAKEIKEKKISQKGSQLDIALDYVLYGQDNVKESQRLLNVAMDKVKKKDFKEAFPLFINAYKLYPNNVKVLENALNCLNELKAYDKIINVYSDDTNIINLSGKIKFLVVYSFYKTDKLKSACDLVSIDERVSSTIYSFLNEACS